MIEFNKYVGIPFEDGKLDCYGLIRLIYKQELNIELPEFLSSATDTRKIWVDYIKQISEHWYLVTEYKPYDVIAFAYDHNHPKIVQHFGIYIGNGMMLHSLDKIGSFTCPISDFSGFLKGVYRWKQLDLKNPA